MNFSVIWHEKALNELKFLEKKAARKIVERIKNYLVQKPGSLGKPLKGVLKGLYRYRTGDFRIIYAIDREEHKIIILHIAHRKNAYS